MNKNTPFLHANSAALRFISYKPRSEAEVRMRLRRNFPADLTEKVVTALKKRSLLDDVTFANLWRDARVSLNPRSATTIRHELISKGIDQELATETVSSVDDRDCAYRVALKFARRLQHTNISSFNRKLTGYLQRRGFSTSVTRNALTRVRDEMTKCL